LDEATLRKYFGGTCLGAKYLHDEVDPKIDWSHPENRLFVGSGPIGGTRVPGSGCISFVTKGAMTNGAASTQANGFFGAFLKFSGFDAVILQGAASDWKYLYVHDGIAELRDASHLQGQDTWETEESVKKDLGYGAKNMSVFSIGPAGENLVKYAIVCGDCGHVASSNGVGAVMGSKKLKALAVARGKNKVEVADSEQLAAIVKQIVEKGRSTNLAFNRGTTAGVAPQYAVGQLPIKNYNEFTFGDYPDFVSDRVRSVFETKLVPCWACPSQHCEMMKVTEGPYTGYVGEEPEYEQWASWGPQIYQQDPGAAVVLSNDVDRLGMDTNEAAWVIGWVMECYEKGVLTKQDLDGLEMTWGNVEATRALLRNIAHRHGYGKILAEGVKYAAEQLGGEATNWAIYTGKGNSPRTHDHRARWAELLDTCVADSGTYDTNPGMLGRNITLFGMPEPQFDRFSPEEVTSVVARTKGSLQTVDSLVVCAIATTLDLPTLSQAVNAVTGWSTDLQEIFNVGRRAINLMRVFNIKAGLTPDLEKPSTRYGSTPTDGPAKGQSIMRHWEKMLDQYYQLMRWDRKTGMPLSNTLKEIGLEHLVK